MPRTTMRLAATMLVRVATATSPLHAQAAAPVRIALPNGLVVWVQEDHHRPVALVQTVYKVGSLNEGPGTTGTAHYVEHMMYRSTDHVRAEDIYGYNDRLGGRWTGSTSQTTNYGEVVPAWGLENALRVTADRMGHASFDSTEFTRERNMVLTEANGFARSDPVSAFHDAVMRASFELHPYRYSSNTWAQDNLLVTREVVRDFYRRFYGPNNATISVVGDVRVEDVRRLVDKYFAPLPPAPETGEVHIVEPPQRVEKRVALTAPGVRPQIEIVYRTPQASHPDFPVLSVLDRVLGPRVRQAVTVAGGSDPATSYEPRPYPFVYRFTASADSGADLERIVNAIQGEIERVGRILTSGELGAALSTSAAAAGGRGGRGGGGGRGVGASPSVWNPPRNYPVLSDLATSLAAREVLPWEVGPDMLARIARAEGHVTPQDLGRYVDRWMRSSQRTVGVLVPGKSDFMPRWSTDRALTGERLDVPPMVTPPAKRHRPEPVPARSLEPLPKLALSWQRALLANGVIVRVARATTAGSDAAAHVRLTLGAAADPPGKEGLALLAARLLAADSGLVTRSRGVDPALSGATSIANDGVYDLHLHVPTESLTITLHTVAGALARRTWSDAQVGAERARMAAMLTAGPALNTGTVLVGFGASGRGGDVGTSARRIAIEAVAPEWQVAPRYTVQSLARITAGDVRDFLARHLMGGSVTVAVVAPLDTAPLRVAAADAFASMPARKSAARRSGARARSRSDSPDNRASIADERIAAPGETQVTIVAGLPGVTSDNPDRRALELLNYIVGLPQYGGRMGWAVTRAGLAYAAGAATTYGASTGFILLNTKTDTHNAVAAIQCIREIVEDIGARGVEPWELDEAKSFVLGRTLLYGPWNDSDNETIASALIESESRGEELLDLPAFSRSTLGVTLEQVNAAAKRYYRPDLLKVVAIGALPASGEQSPFAPGVFRAVFEP
jgi:zinc protease